MPKRKKTTKRTRLRLYSASKHLNSAAKEELGIRIPFDVYLQDPLVAARDPEFGIHADLVRWEPGLSDGPTSARFAVVDYNNDTDDVAPKAVWDETSETFVDPDYYILDRDNTDSLQYNQVHVWAVLQRALEFFEEGDGLGRPIPYGFDGNRLIVVPHAGYGRNAFYDRSSKSLQFYYFDDDDGQRVNTCLSTDIINHEFGHAVLDGVRPLYYSSSLVETGAFHEFVGDLSAILLLLRNNKFRGLIARESGGKMSEAKRLSNLAEQFGSAVSDKPYLRTAQNDLTMADITDDDGPHKISQVLTGAMFDILMAFSDYKMAQGHTAKEAFWAAIDRMQRVAIQPLDLLPPVDVTFKDYAWAVLRAEELANPTDPHCYCEMMVNAFRNRKIFDRADVAQFMTPRYIFHRLRVDVQHDIEDIARSRSAAYRFLDDNRDQLFIPSNQDVVVADLYDANKLTREGLELPRQIILEYTWKEEVVLEGEQFGEYENQVTAMHCGGTLVFDENGNVLSWFRKPGTQEFGRPLTPARQRDWGSEVYDGKARLQKFLHDLAHRIERGQIGALIGSGKGLLGTHMPPVVVQSDGNHLHFTLSPHMHLAGEDHDHFEGGGRWEVSS